MTAGTRIAAAAAIAAVAGLAPLGARQAPPTFRAKTEAVVVPVAVSDGGHVVGGLTQADFEVTDNGVAQTISSAAMESLPIGVTLVLDVSASVDGDALTRFVADVQTMAQSLQPPDWVRLLTFSSVVRDVFGEQPGGRRLPIDRIAAGGGTSFYNALVSALLTTAASDRPELVFAFSDGHDTTSFVDADAVATVARSSPAVLYLTLVGPHGSRIQSSSPSFAGSPMAGSTTAWNALTMAPYAYDADIKTLRDVAEKSGGALYTKAIGASIAETFAEAYANFRTRYVLTYTPQGVPPVGWHTLAVRVKGQGYTIRARAGYEGG